MKDDSADRLLFQILMQDPHFREEIEQLYQERTQEREEEDN